MWYSSSVSVWEGATTMESPVCVPSGSKFSMLQQMIVFCARAATSASASQREQGHKDAGGTHVGAVAYDLVLDLLPALHTPLHQHLRKDQRLPNQQRVGRLTWGERLSPRAARSRISSSSCAKPEPRPPRVKAERMMTG